MSKYLTLNVVELNPPLNKLRNNRRKYTLETFIETARSVHGNKYDYNFVTQNEIKSNKSKVPIKCNTCGHKWDCSISNHVNHKRECPQCMGVLRWNYDRLISSALSIHGDKFDYSQIIPEQIKNKRSSIALECTICDHHFETTVERHVVKKRGCPSCSKRLPWTYKRLMEEASEIHENRINYSKVAENDIRDGHKSKLTLICNICLYEWVSSVDSHIRRKHGCPNCARNAPWTYERLLNRLNQVHRQKYSYHKITNDHRLGCKSKIPVICNKCACEWECNKSRGEIKCANYLQSIGINFEPQGKITTLPTKRYDFKFFYLGKWFLLEYDGIQHFKYINYFNKNVEGFIQRPQIDILKTKMAIQEGYTIIRIDYSNMSNAEIHINKALTVNSNI